MSKGGKRKGAGSPSWNNLPTKPIRVPSSLAPFLLKLARVIDNEEPLYIASSLLKDLYLNNLTFEDYDSLSYSDENQISLVDGEQMATSLSVDALYYITHISNVNSILNRGILSHSLIEKEGISHFSIYNAQVVNRRNLRRISIDKTLWDYANLYFQPRNAMLYSLYKSSDSAINDLAIISVNKTILKRKDVYITTGNAASNDSEIIPISDAKQKIGFIRRSISKDWWSNEDGSKRTIMAECLVPNKVSPSYISHIYVCNEQAKSKLENNITECQRFNSGDINIYIEPKRFFQPDLVKSVSDKVKIVKGDLFFSRAQTLTISVNCVGVMGKGLASTAKYRFPDVYVHYQDLCKNKKISYSTPQLYKRESSIFVDLHDEYSGLSGIDKQEQTWFLLFATKEHWKNNSSIEGIEKGLIWLEKNCKLLGITSLAIPALGCGQGNLDWKDVGPLMFRYLYRLNIPVSIYLPAEKEIPEDQISKEFLIQF